MAQDLDALAGQLLQAAAAAGADAADVVVGEGSGLSMEIRHGKLEQAERAEGIDLGLRVFLGQRQASVSVSDASPATITEMAERAVFMAREAPEDPYAGLAAPEQLATDWDIAALDLEDASPEPSPEALAERAAQAEAAALSVEGVAQVDSAGAGYGKTRMHMATSNGFSAGYARTSHSTSCVAISGEGLSMERDYCGEGRIHAEDMPDAPSIGTLAGERAVARAGASKPPTGAYPVVFDERVSSSLVGHV
ncbi:MAG: DNA gyrase modulator, partial [Pseudomonadota bacterium]